MDVVVTPLFFNHKMNIQNWMFCYSTLNGVFDGKYVNEYNIEE